MTGSFKGPSSRRMCGRRPSAWILAAAGAPLLAGCPPQTTHRPDVSPPDPSRGALGGDEPWPFRPVQMRIHPLTRLASNPDSDGPMIEARLEFFDAWDDPAKCLGVVTLELYGAAGEHSPMELRARWKEDLGDLQQNEANYDVVTRMYLIRLQIEPASLAEHCELRCTYLGDDGLELHDSLRLRLR